jgi:hypothetical protein
MSYYKVKRIEITTINGDVSLLIHYNFSIIWHLTTDLTTRWINRTDTFIKSMN